MQRHEIFHKIGYFVGLCMLTVLAASSKVADAPHPFYVSVTEIRSDSQQQTFTVSARMFTDDLQQALFKQYQYKGTLSEDDGSADEALTQYLAAHLTIKVNNTAVALQFIGYETEEEATWCHLEAKAFPGTGTVAVNNRLLYDYITEQTNLVHCYKNGTRTSHKLVNPDSVVQF